jgi:hypothetical protein
MVANLTVYVKEYSFWYCLETMVLVYSRAPVSTDSVFAVSVVRGLLWPGKKRIEKLNK